MRIAQVAPLTEAIPPKLYGGTERVVHWLTEELVALGHDVTLFASGDSCTSAKLEPFWPRALRLDGSVRDPNALHMAMLEQVRRRADKFDALHFHLDYYPFSLFSRQRTPFVTTLHGRLDLPEHQPAFDTFSIRAGGVDFERAAPAAAAGALGPDRPSRPAGAAADAAAGQAVLFRVPRPHRAGKARRHARSASPSIAASRSRSPPRSIAPTGTITTRQIRPLMSSRYVDYIGEINDHEKSAFLSGAIALLVPIDWPEPFGLVMIEAMACGTPVIAFNRGSVPELIEDGVTGFIVEDEAGAIGAVDRLAHLSRRRSASASSSASRRGGWRSTISRSTAADGGRTAAAARRVGRGCRARAADPMPLSAYSVRPALRPPAGFPADQRHRPQGRGRDAGEPEERDLAAELVAQIAGERRADRGADPDRGADDALREIEMSGAARDVGDHQRHHDAERRPP